VSHLKKKDKPEKALNEGGEEANAPDTTPVAEPKASGEVPEPKAEPEPTGEEEAEEEGEETGEVSKKKGFSKRVRELSGKAKEAEAEAEKAKAEVKSLSERLAELTGEVSPSVDPSQPIQPQQIEPIVGPGEEIDGNELERRLQAREQRTLRQADALAVLRTKQQNTINRINNEAVAAMRDYPELDPESDSFDKELSDSVTEAVEAQTIQFGGYDQFGKPVYTINLNSSVKKIVGKLMKPYKGAVTKAVGEEKENLAKQVSESALRPTAVKPSGKSVDDMSPEELEKKLGVVY
jgi:hypothetical protein